MTGGGGVLVTGAGGFIGSAVVRRAGERGIACTPVAHRWSAPAELSGWVDAARPTACIHLGWHADPSDYLTAVPENLRSLTDSLDLLAALGAVGCGHLVAAGSSAEYARPGDATPLRVTDRVAPTSPYGAAKAALRMFLGSTARPDGLAFCWARIFNVTGAGERPDRLLPRVACAVLDGAPIELSDGGQLRDFLDVDDVADALLDLSAARADGDVNVCSGDGVPLRSLLEELAGALGSTDLLRFGALAATPSERADVVGDAGPLRRCTAWVPRHPRSEMITRVAEHWRQRHQEAKA